VSEGNRKSGGYSLVDVDLEGVIHPLPPDDRVFGSESGKAGPLGEARPDAFDTGSIGVCNRSGCRCGRAAVLFDVLARRAQD
jgi:hypothetical protein